MWPGTTSRSATAERSGRAASSRKLTSGAPVRRCSFCGKDRSGVARLCAGPRGVAICNECVELVREVFAEEAAPAT